MTNNTYSEDEIIKAISKSFECPISAAHKIMAELRRSKVESSDGQLSNDELRILKLNYAALEKCHTKDILRIEGLQAKFEDLRRVLVDIRGMYKVACKDRTKLEARIEELEEREQRTRVAVYEMHHDNLKGDFELSELARLDLDAIIETLKQEGAK